MTSRTERLIFRIRKKLGLYSPSQHMRRLVLKDLQAAVDAMEAIRPEVKRRLAQEHTRRTMEKLNEQGS